MCMFLLGNVLMWTTDSPVSLYSSELFPTRHNFLLIATLLILPCWLISHLFDWLHTYLDTGVATCGATFRFGRISPNSLEFKYGMF